MKKKSKLLAIVIMTIGMFLVVLGDVILFNDLNEEASSNNNKQPEVVSGFQKLINDIKNYNSYKVEFNLNKDSNNLFDQIILFDQINKLEKLENKSENFIIDLKSNDYYKLIEGTYQNINTVGLKFENDMLGILQLLEYSYENIDLQDNQILEFTLNKNNLISYLENKNYYIVRQLELFNITEVLNDGKIIVNIMDGEIRSLIINFMDINNSDISLVLTISEVNNIEDFSNFKEN